ncbi:MAG: Holliday junction resolvase RuvX [Gammaproteobacteria bacterium]|nr:Holliday junction resolvase RuvX [Gammaproteobacteria bacterium]MCF6231383.1 Holliday junction resolvase RuvX [Gammaproteobacteria bacterium]
MPESTVLGFDYGRRRIGVAVGQTITHTSSPLATIQADQGKPDWHAVQALINEWQPTVFVVGMPKNMDGSAHQLTATITRFGNQLHGRYGLPVHYIDERLSSREAERSLMPGQAKKDKGVIDRVAAQLILQTWLDQER